MRLSVLCRIGRPVKNSSSPPVASFTFEPATIDDGESVNFTDTSTGNPTSWSWSRKEPGGGGFVEFSTERNPTGITFVGVGEWEIQLVASNSAGASDPFGDNLVVTGWTPADLPGLEVAIWAGIDNQYVDNGVTLASVSGTDTVQKITPSFGTSKALVQSNAGDRPVYRGNEGFSLGASGELFFEFDPANLILDVANSLNEGTLIIVANLAGSDALSVLLSTVPANIAIIYANAPSNIDAFDDSAGGGSAILTPSAGPSVIWITRELGEAAAEYYATGSLSNGGSSGTYTFSTVGGIDPDLGSGSDPSTRIKGIFKSSQFIAIDSVDGLAMREWLTSEGYTL